MARVGDDTIDRRPIFVVSLLWLLTSFTQPVWAQAQTTEPPTSNPGKLKLVIVEGEGAINNIKTRTAGRVIVQVEYENHRPVAGATVAFTLPGGGAGGSFAHAGRTFSVVSDQGGRAVSAVIKPNHIVGAFKLNVTAGFNHQIVATATVSQTNAITTAGVATAAGPGTASGTSSAGTGASSGAASGAAPATGTAGAGGGVGGASGAAAGGGAGTAGATGAGGVAAGTATATAAATAGAISTTTIVVVAAGGAAVAGVVAAKAASGGDSKTPSPPTATVGAPGAPSFGPTSLTNAFFHIDRLSHAASDSLPHHLFARPFTSDTPEHQTFEYRRISSVIARMAAGSSRLRPLTPAQRLLSAPLSGPGIMERFLRVSAVHFVAAHMLGPLPTGVNLSVPRGRSQHGLSIRWKP